MQHNCTGVSTPAAALVSRQAVLRRVPGGFGLKPCTQPCLIQQVRLHLHVERHAICLHINPTFVFLHKVVLSLHQQCYRRKNFLFLLEGKAISRKTMVHLHMPHRKNNLNFQLLCVCRSGQILGISSELNGTWSKPTVCSVYMQYGYRSLFFLTMTLFLSNHNVSPSKRMFSEML